MLQVLHEVPLIDYISDELHVIAYLSICVNQMVYKHLLKVLQGVYIDQTTKTMSLDVMEEGGTGHCILILAKYAGTAVTVFDYVFNQSKEWYK